MSGARPSPRRRLACLLYEGLVVFSILLIGFLLPQIVLSGFHLELSPRLLWLHVWLLLLAYFVWCWLNGGQTLPMKTWKLQLISSEGTALRPLQAVFRYMLAWPGTVLFGIGFFWAIVDKDGLYLHDRIAGTRIVSTAH